MKDLHNKPKMTKSCGNIFLDLGFPKRSAVIMKSRCLFFLRLRGNKGDTSFKQSVKKLK